MPTSRLWTADYWYKRAEEQRSIATNMLNAQCRMTMLNLADTSDMVAKNMEGKFDRQPAREPLDVSTDRIERILVDYYHTGLYWLIMNKGGPNGGWPPRDVQKVQGWTTVRMLAKLSGKSAPAVAADLIEHHQMYEEGRLIYEEDKQ